MITWSDFEKIDMRVGTIVEAEQFPEAKKPAYKLTIDFGEEIGMKRSSAQITRNYEPDSLLGKQVIAVVNFPAKQIGPFMSECLVMGSYESKDEILLITPDQKATNGTKIG